MEKSELRSNLDSVRPANSAADRQTPYWRLYAESRKGWVRLPHGNLDLLLANGNPDDLIATLHGEVTYEEPPMLFHHNGKSLENVSLQSGTVFAKPLSARGMAIGDLDNDGAIDVLISVLDGEPVLLRNKVGGQSHWLGINLIGRKSNPDAIGARITYQSGDLKRQRMKVGGGSFLSSHDP